MAYNIYEKVNNIFSDELEDNKRLLFSPMKPFSKFSKKFQDNHFSLNHIEKSMDTSADKNKSPKHKKKQMKIIKENNKPNITHNSNKKLKVINNNNHSKNSSKNILSTIKSIIKSNKEKENKKDNDITDSGYPLNDKESKRVRGKTSNNQNHLTSSPYIRGIPGKERDSKRIKISRFELDNDKNEKIEEEELKLNEDEETIKEKNKKASKIKDKINDKSFSNPKNRKNRRILVETNDYAKKERNNKSIFNDSMNSEKNNQSPKSRGKKLKRNYITKSTKDIQNKTKKIKEKIKNHYSDKKKIELLTPPMDAKQNDKDISSYNSSNLSPDSSSLSNINKAEKRENKKTNNIKTNNNAVKNNINNNNNNISDESNFHSSIFSNDSNDNEGEIIKKKIIPKTYKSSKSIKFFANRELNNFKIKKFTNKKSQEYYNNSKDYKNIQEKDEESKGSSESTKKIDDKGKNRKIKNDKISNSEINNLNLKRGNSKRKIYIPSPSQYKISPKVNNILILSDKDNRHINENNDQDKDINQNMNIISPGNFISIEYNINHGKKEEKDLEIKNNNIIINNNESNNITCYRKDIRNKNEIKERINEDDNIINENNNGYDEYINSQNNIIKGKKKPRKRFCFCCL